MIFGVFWLGKRGQRPDRDSAGLRTSPHWFRPKHEPDRNPHQEESTQTTKNGRVKRETAASQVA